MYLMDPEVRKRFDNIEASQKSMARTVNEIKLALVGDRLNPEVPQGLMEIVEDHHTVLHGCEKEKTKGLVEMVQVLWEGRAKVITVCVCITTVGGFLGWLIPVLIHFLRQ